MNHLLRCSFLILLFSSSIVRAQDSAAYKWDVTSKKISKGVYELTFSTPGNSKWQLYSANEVINEVPAVLIVLIVLLVVLKPFR